VRQGGLRRFIPFGPSGETGRHTGLKELCQYYSSGGQLFLSTVNFGVSITFRSRETISVIGQASPHRQHVHTPAIEFHIPGTFRKSEKWIPPKQRGKIIEFAPETKKTA
jgi:hypothetical protein